jgi:hypothetical protein
MSGTTTGIVVIVVVIVVCLAVWLGSVALAARHPQQEHPQRDPMRGLVQGGQHVGGGRSVAPHRDKPVPEGGGNPPTPEKQDQTSHSARQD